jgi:uncharacterized phage protein (TIGR02218 family)
MKPASSGLIALLATGEFQQADLYTLSPIGGGTLRFTTCDTDVLYGGNVYSASGPRFDSAQSQATGHWKTGLDVSTWTISIIPRAEDAVTGALYPDMIGSMPFTAAVAAGALDGAIVQVDRAYWPDWPTPWASPIVPTDIIAAIFAGKVADITLDRSSVVLTLNSHLELLTIQMPREVYQSACRHTLFDSGCTLLASSFGKAGAAQTGSTQQSIRSTISAPSGSGTYALGRIMMTSGVNNGFARMVKAWDGVRLTLLSPMPYPVAPGDTFNAYPGCNKTSAQCAQFGNTANFGGQPFIPVPETALQ